MQPVRFATLRQILLDLGFTLRVEPNDFARFDHPQSNNWFVFPPFGDDDPVPTPHLIGVGRHLDESGLMSRDEFDELLRRGLIAG